MRKAGKFNNGMYWHRDEYTDCLKEQITKRIDINMASIILVDGGQGQGKTTLCVHTADYHNHLVGMPPIDLSAKNHPQIGMGGVDFISKFNKCQREGYPIVIYDEAGDYSKASTLSWFNYQMSKLFQKIRSAKIIVLICLPNFNVLDNRLFDDEIIRGAVHCHNRQQTVTYGNFNVYNLNQLSWIRHWYNKLPIARRHSCYNMVSPLFQSRFKNLPKKRAKQLEILSSYGKESERQQAEVRMRGLLSINALTTELSRSKIWVYKKLKALNINEEATVRLSKYYTKDTLRKLEKEIEGRRK